MHLPVLAVDRYCIDRGGQSDPTTEIGHLFCKDQIGVMGKNAAVYVAARHINKAVCSVRRRHQAKHLHRQTGGLSGIPGKERVIRVRQVEISRRYLQKLHSMIVDGQRGVRNLSHLCLRQTIVERPGQLQHRQRPFKNPLGNERAQRQHFLPFAEDKRRRGKPAQR